MRATAFEMVSTTSTKVNGLTIVTKSRGGVTHGGFEYNYIESKKVTDDNILNTVRRPCPVFLCPFFVIKL